MKKTALFFSLVIITVSLGSCIIGWVEGNGNVTEQVREVGEFSKIIATRGMNVYIVQGAESKIVVKADENLLDDIETTVSDKTLKVSCNRIIRKAESNKVFVTVKNLEMIKSTAGSNIFAEDTLRLNEIEIKGSAGGNAHLALQSSKLNISASSGANIYINGTTNSLFVKASSGANIKAGDLAADICEIRSSSGANIWLKAKKEFSAYVSSGANVFYSGNPETTNIEKSSGGNVIKN